MEPAATVTPEAAKNGALGPIAYPGYLANALVTRELWDEAQRALARRRERAGAGRPSSDYPLRGLVKCAACGVGWHGHPATGRARRDASGVVTRPRVRYYAHHRRDLVGAAPEAALGGGVPADCEHAGRAIRADGIEAAAFGAARAVLAGDALAAEVCAELDRRMADLAGRTDVAAEERMLAADVAEAARKLHAAVAALVDGTDGETREALEALKQERVEVLRAARARLAAFRDAMAELAAARARADAHYRAAPDLVRLFDTSGAATRRQLLSAVLSEVRVFWDACPDGHVVEVHARAVPGDDPGPWPPVDPTPA